MNNTNFYFYRKEYEEPGGAYWQLLDASIEDLEKNDIYLSDINKIMQEIQNEELKAKLKNKIYDIIMSTNIHKFGLSCSLPLFNQEELKKILEHETIYIKEKYLSDKEKIKYYLSDIIGLIRSYNLVKDDEWNYKMTTSFIDSIKDLENKSLLIDIIEYNDENVEKYNKLIKDYYDYLPIEYKNYLKMNEDPYYAKNKIDLFMNENIDIGIDPNISIGLEIESNRKYYLPIKLERQKGLENFRITRDATVPDGDEIITKEPFHNTKEDVSKLCGLCETMKDIGYHYNEVSSNASGQINLGLEYLDTKESILNFYEIYGNCEELLYYISSEEGQLFRQDVYSSSRIKPISEIIGKRAIDENLTRYEIIGLFNNRYSGEDETLKGLEYKKNSVCLRGTYEEDYRFEFRIPNGGCNYRTWIDNIRLYGKMLEVSKKLADMMKKDYLTEEEQRLLNIKIELQNIEMPFDKKLVKLMNLLFEDENIRKIYYSRYISTMKRIEETNSIKYRKQYGTFQHGFDEVEFIEQYNSNLGIESNGNSIEYDPETNEISYK